MTNVAYILSLIAPLFSYLKEEDYVSMQQNLAWQDVRAAAGAPLQEALSLPTWPARSSFQNELLVPGMPLAAMPVESLYKAWSTQQGNAFGATRRNLLDGIAFLRALAALAQRTVGEALAFANAAEGEAVAV